ncbi:MAG: HelD family protein [Candidatus Scatovivens sp.]
MVKQHTILLKKKLAGEILLKRQFFIDNKILYKIFDIDETAIDELLQDALATNADDRLKNIVATIQEEQNKIIRAPIDKPLIIQGVAGSGKSSIALHRIAYLIYKYEKNFNPESFMVIAPNKFFLNYISNVLPDLGVDNVKQYTFEDFTREILGRKIRIVGQKEKLISIINRSFSDLDNGEVELMLKEAKFKSSLKFRDIIDKYLEQLADKLLPKRDFILSNVRIIKKETIRDLFFNTYNNLPFEQRVNEIKKHVFSKIRNNSYIIIKESVAKRSVDIQKLMKKDLPLKVIKSKKNEIFDRTEKLLKMLYKEDIKIVDLYLGNMSFKSARAYYKDFIANFAYDYIEDKELSRYLIDDTKQDLVRSDYAFEDLAPLIYIHSKIFGTKFSTKLKHIIIDDAQDYGEFQFSVLKDILNSESMTILGDIAQGVYFYRGVENWNDFVKTQFPENGANIVTLNKTYRSTSEIIKIANRVINKLPKRSKSFIINAQPIIKSSGSINIFDMQNYDEIGREIARKLREIQKTDKYKSVAIIGKDMKECRNIRKILGTYIFEPNLIESQDSEYKAGINIIPSYLAKGLEFDYVMLVNVSEENYTNNPLDIKLLYIAITRAMSKLDIFFIKNISKLIIE